MSNDTSSPAVQQSSAPALRLAESFAALDRFAAANSVTTLLEGDEGAFTLTLKMSAAMQQLREMITPEMMKPIMALQGSSLGFRTDKDKEGGYPESVVKEAMIEKIMVVAPTTAVPINTGFAVALKVFPAPSFSSR